MAKKAAAGERTQTSMVEELLDAGIQSPTDLFEAVKSKFGVEIGKANINQIKVKWKKRQSGTGIAPKKARAKSAASPSVPVAAPAVAEQGIASIAAGKSESFNSPKTLATTHAARDGRLIEATLVLCKTFGADAAREIIESFKENNV